MKLGGAKVKFNYNPENKEISFTPNPLKPLIKKSYIVNITALDKNSVYARKISWLITINNIILPDKPFLLLHPLKALLRFLLIQLFRFPAHKRNQQFFNAAKAFCSIKSIVISCLWIS